MSPIVHVTVTRERDANLSDERDLKKVYDEDKSRMRYMGFIITELEYMFGNRVVPDALTPLRLCKSRTCKR
ncbi:hypothetical protein CTI12_AA147890 [Artemisia annua]|uniref:Uncharacterized protein n=1 Tax=Artemisia annua TaxID=35608 RepID=A0A2U1PIN6_ARTAN|nr:hypothetical protein CTI12_AA147890 [Artemisia annua]